MISALATSGLFYLDYIIIVFEKNQINWNLMVWKLPAEDSYGKKSK